MENLQEFINTFFANPLLVITIGAFIAILFLLIIVNGGSIKLGKYFQFATNPFKREKKENTVVKTLKEAEEECEICPTRPFIDNLFDEKFNAWVEAFKKETIIYRHKAEGYGDVALTSIKQKLFLHYIKLFKERFPDIPHPRVVCEADNYRKTLEIIKRDLEVGFQGRIAQNGISEKKRGRLNENGEYIRDTWDFYLDMVVEDLINKLDISLETYFWSKHISLDELIKHNQKIMPELTEIYRSLFEEVKRLGDEVKDDVEKLRKKYSIKINTSL